MQNKSNILLFIAATLAGSCCNQTNYPSDEYMILDKIEFKESFPHTLNNNPTEQLECKVLGATTFKIQDSLIIFSSSDKDGMWSIFNLPELKFLGKFLKLGNGPNELLEQPWVGTNTSFYKKRGSLYSAIYDSPKNRIFEFNITISLQKKELDIHLLKDSLPPNLAVCILLDSNTFFCREMLQRPQKQNRFILKDSNRLTTRCIEKLNTPTIGPGEDLNIISTMIRYNSKFNRIIEMPLNLNYINIYSTECSFAKTITMDRRLDNIKEIENRNMGDRIYRHGNLRVYDNFFGVLFINEDKKDFQTKRKTLPSIRLYSMSGDPIAEIHLTHFATSFDIDFQNDHLYTYDFKLEQLYRSSIKQVLKFIPETSKRISANHDI